MGESSPVTLTRSQLLVASRAAGQWPLGRSGYYWFSSEEAEQASKCPRPIFIAVARRFGDPAVAAAAYSAHRAGSESVVWRKVWEVQEILLTGLSARGESSYNDCLMVDPLRVARILVEWADSLEEGKCLR